MRLLAFHSNVVSSTCILHHFRDMAIYWSTIADFDLPQLYLGLAPPLRVTPSEFGQDIWLH